MQFHDNAIHRFTRTRQAKCQFPLFDNQFCLNFTVTVFLNDMITNKKAFLPIIYLGYHKNILKIDNSVVL